MIKGGLGGLLKQAQVMKKKLAQVQEKMEAEVVEAASGDGLVRVTANCRQQIRSITIAPEALEDPGMLEDLVLTAVNRALTEGRERNEKEVARITGGIDFPMGL